MKFSAKTIINQSSNIIFIVVLAFVLLNRLPKWIESFKKEGSKVEQSLRVRLLDGSETDLPAKSKKVLVFWATWFGPCTLELSRIQSLITNQKILADKIFAVALDGDLETIRKTSSERGYTFNVAQDLQGQLSHLFNVEVTPTILLIDEEDKIQWMTTGLSPTLEFRLKSFAH